MLCSARDLGLSDDHSGLLEIEGKPGSDARAALGLDDHILTLKLTPNRADCLSVLGVAREVAAVTGAASSSRSRSSRCRRRARRSIRCSITAPRRLRPVRRPRDPQRGRRRRPTPQWMKQRLERAGQRSISALVDVTNYVMLELGRPLHVYDLDKLRGADRGALGPQGREGAAAERAGGRGRRLGAVHHRRLGRDRPGRHHGRREHQGRRGHAERVPRVGVLLPRRDRRAARGATTSRATPRTASSAASISTTTSTASSAPRA